MMVLAVLRVLLVGGADGAPPASVCGGWPVPGHTAWVNVR